MVLRNIIYFMVTASITQLFGCKSQKDSAKFNFADGVYHTSVKGERQQVYVENTEDSISIYSLKKGWRNAPMKPSALMKKSFAQKPSAENMGSSKY